MSSSTLTSVVYSQGCKRHHNRHACVFEYNMSRHYIWKPLCMQTFAYTCMFVTGMKHSLLLMRKPLLAKATRIIHYNIHILHDEHICLPSYRRSQAITSKTSGKHFSFILIYVRLFNNKHL